MTPEALVRSAAARAPVPLVEEISLLTAAPALELWELWQQTERDDPPFWAYPWAGGQALARHLLDNPGTVRGRRVLAGSLTALARYEVPVLTAIEDAPVKTVTVYRLR